MSIGSARAIRCRSALRRLQVDHVSGCRDVRSAYQAAGCDLPRRRGNRRTYVNLMATMLLGDLWHGAAWTFVAWGALHGLLLAVDPARKDALVNALHREGALCAAVFVVANFSFGG